MQGKTLPLLLQPSRSQRCRSLDSFFFHQCYSYRDPYDEGQACGIVNSIVDAVAYMHSKEITHRDLKFENIMFATPTSYSIKIIDFGLSKKYAHAEHLHETVGTVYTMARTYKQTLF